MSINIYRPTFLEFDPFYGADRTIIYYIIVITLVYPLLTYRFFRPNKFRCRRQPFQSRRGTCDNFAVSTLFGPEDERT